MMHLKQKLKCLLPNFIKPIVRFVWYKNEKRKIFKEIIIRLKQNKLIQQNYPADCENLIVFIVDGANWFTGYESMNGGILSIASIYEETEKLESIHDCKTIMVTHDEAYLLLNYTQFPSQIILYRLSQLFSYFTRLKKVIIHIADCNVVSVTKQFKKYKNNLLPLQELQINILNQSIHLMPSAEEISVLKQYTQNITQTTAHEQYTTLEYRKKYKIPLHKLSVFGSPENYMRLPFGSKENLIIVSPDEQEDKELILQKIKKQFPNYKIVIVQNMPYLTYLNLISRAKYTITFGEGLDFYFIETVFSGGIGIAVYNQFFFTKDFYKLPGLFEDYRQLQNELTTFIQSNDNSTYFSELNKLQYAAVSKIYKYDDYVENVKKFYLKDYTFK